MLVVGLFYTISQLCYGSYQEIAAPNFYLTAASFLVAVLLDIGREVSILQDQLEEVLLQPDAAYVSYTRQPLLSVAIVTRKPFITIFNK